MHIQYREQDWDAATDEAHIQGLFQTPATVNNLWLSYLKQYRPHVFDQYLSLWESNLQLSKPFKFS